MIIRLSNGSPRSICQFYVTNETEFNTVIHQHNKKPASFSPITYLQVWNGHYWVNVGNERSSYSQIQHISQTFDLPSISQISAMSDYLAHTEIINLYLLVAEHPRTKNSDLVLLAKSNKYLIRRAIAKHPRTPLATLKQLSQDSERSIHNLASARLTTTPLPILMQLLKSRTCRQFALATIQRKNISPGEKLKALMSFSNPDK